MSVPTIITFPAVQVNLDPTQEAPLPVLAWMLNYTAAAIPGEAAPWMLAQGWQLSGMSYDSNTTPPTPYYNFYRSGMATGAVLQSLVNVYTRQYNEGRYLNAARYNNIVTNWQSLIATSVQQLDVMAAVSNGNLGIAINRLDAVTPAVDAAAVTDLAKTATTEAALAAALEAYRIEFSTWLAELATYYSISTGLLTGLGATELTRINEACDARLAEVAQNLVNRGLYSSALLGSEQDRVERERNQHITELNDKLAREKVENERFNFQHKMSTLERMASAKLQIHDAKLRDAQTVQELRSRLIALRLETAMNYARVVLEKNTQEMQLMRYQVDTRSGLVIGLFGFEEKRFDLYPSMDVLAKLCMSLGDSAATSWISP